MVCEGCCRRDLITINKKLVRMDYKDEIDVANEVIQSVPTFVSHVLNADFVKRRFLR
jgi:hypothetical protein